MRERPGEAGRGGAKQDGESGLKEAGEDFFRTKRQLEGTLSRAGVRPRRRMGQSFLIDRNLAELLLRTAGLTERSVVLEVGTGCGMLTGMLAQRTGRVVTVEVDRRLLAIARERLAGSTNVTRLPCPSQRGSWVRSNLCPLTVRSPT